MTDKELFIKYNLVDTTGKKKDAQLTETLYRGEYIDRTERHHHSNSSILLLLHGSYACNSACIYCENHCLREQYNGAMITEEIVRETVRKLGPVLREITWHGGEPLLVPENVMAALNDEKAKYGYKFDISLQTNSILYTDEKKAFLDSLGIKCGTSFDGLDNTHNRGQQSTDAVISRIQRVNGDIGFICVTTKETIGNMIQNYEYFKSLGVKAFRSCIVRENVIESTNPYLVSSELAAEKMLEYIDYYIHDLDNPINEQYVMQMINCLMGDTHTCDNINCIGGWMIMDPYGNLTFCGHSALTDPICNIKDIQSSHDLLTNRKYIRDITRQRKLLKQCEDCVYYKGCYGGCMGLNYEQDHEYRTINQRYCTYFKLLMDGIFDMISDIKPEDYPKYNPLFVKNLIDNCYYPLSECKQIEEDHNG